LLGNVDLHAGGGVGRFHADVRARGQRVERRRLHRGRSRVRAGKLLRRACPAGEHCLRPLVIGGASGTVTTGAYLCFPVNRCDPLDPATGCAAGTTCQLVDPTGATACAPEGMGVPGQPCPCKGGFVCVANGCRRLCRATVDGGAPACPAEEGSCVHFNRDPGGVGECTPL